MTSTVPAMPKRKSSGLPLAILMVIVHAVLPALFCLFLVFLVPRFLDNVFDLTAEPEGPGGIVIRLSRYLSGNPAVLLIVWPVALGLDAGIFLALRAVGGRILAGLWFVIVLIVQAALLVIGLGLMYAAVLQQAGSV